MKWSRATKIALVAIISAVVLGTLAAVAWRLTTPESGLLDVSGRIESDKITLASKVMGRVVAIRVREGAAVTPRETMALLDDRTAQAQLAEGRAAAEAAVSQVAATRASLGVLRQEVPDAIASADAGIAVAHANLHQVQGVAVQAGLDSARAQTLLQSHLIDTQTAQRSALAWRIAQEQQAAAVADIRKAEQALRDARAARSRHGDVAAGYSARLF